MHNITLISTRHDEIGDCNSFSLYKILLAIRPDVIFVELPPSLFSEYYIERRIRKLETNSVCRYLENFKKVVVPVDINDIPSKSFFKEYQNAIEQILDLEDINGETFRALSATKKRNNYFDGFRFLNSDYYIQCNNLVTDALEKALEKLNNERLNLAYQRWTELSDRRENEMLQNIYNYSRNHNYNKAVFLLGASHRKSIKEKIEACRLKELPLLDWVIYGD